jgi:GTP cyclohydrolase IA
MENKKNDFDLINWLSAILPENELERVSETVAKKPNRITKGYKELLAGYNIKSASEILTVTEEIPEKNYSGLISALDVPFLCFCEHHFLPFTGTVDLIYDPEDVIVGIGKLSRLVDYRTQRFNIQENIAKQLCEDLITFGKARGAFARVNAQHMCACYRGPKKYNARNTVIYSLGSCNNTDVLNKINSIFLK